MKNNNNLSELIKEEKQIYFKNWRKNNKEKVKEHNKRYWEKRVLKKLNKD